MCVALVAPGLLATVPKRPLSPGCGLGESGGLGKSLFRGVSMEDRALDGGGVNMGEGRDLPARGDAGPLRSGDPNTLLCSRRGARGCGALISLIVDCMVARRVRSRVVELLAGFDVGLMITTGWGFEGGMGCDERWTAGEDAEACRREGVMKLVQPATRC